MVNFFSNYGKPLAEYICKIYGNKITRKNIDEKPKKVYRMYK